jgi:hypothetical protein
MQPKDLIAADDFCLSHHIEVSFINSLSDMGLIEMTTMEERCFIDANQLHVIERMVRMHYDLNINLEGIDAITHLLNRVEELQSELVMLRNRLRFYEEKGRFV